MTSRSRTLLLLLAGAVGVALWRGPTLRAQADYAASCAALDAGDAATALARSEAAADAVHPFTDDWLSCRCEALSAADRAGECADELLDLAEREPGWTVDPALTKRVGQILMEAGRYDSLAAWIERWTSESTQTRLSLSLQLQASGDDAGALAALGSPPTADVPGRDAWFEQRVTLLGGAAQHVAMGDTYRAWEVAGAEPKWLMVHYAIMTSAYGLQDANHPGAELLRVAIDQGGDIEDRALLEWAYRSLAGGYLQQGEVEAATAVLDEARAAGLEVAAVSMSEVQRLSDGGVRGTFAFEGARPGDVVLLGAGSDQPVHAPLAPVVGTAERALDARVLPWVVRDSDDRLVASGVAWPGDEPVTTIPIQRGEPRAALSWARTARPGDGRRRVFVVIPDCGDWRIIRYLQARGELPVLRWMEANGVSGVLTSDPPLTAAAMEKLMRPRTSSAVTYLGVLHQLGLEMQGLSSVQENPLEALYWVIPERPYFTDQVGATDKVAANLLFGHGTVDTGRNAELIGPRGQRRAIDGFVMTRPVTDEELTAFPGLGEPPEAGDAAELERITAELDMSIALAGAGDADLVLVRLEPLDLLTHGGFAPLNEPGQDDGQRFLYEAYRYIDARTGDLLDALDGDDVLIWMSDHGIATSLKHDPRAVFLAAGGGVPAGVSLEGEPELDGVPRLLMALLGLEADPRWPETSVSGWVEGSD